jgi:hypothetical protein
MRILILPLLVLPIALSGCSAVGTSTGEPATDSPTASAIATESPEIVTPAVSPLEALNGQTVALNAGDFYDVVLPAGSADAWTATVEKSWVQGEWGDSPVWGRYLVVEINPCTNVITSCRVANMPKWTQEEID